MKIFNKNEWKKVKLGDIFNLQMGKTPLRENKLYWNKGEYNWISISDMNFSEKYVSFTKEKITNLAVKESGIKIIPKNTVIMSFKLSIGKVKIVNDDIYSNEAIMAFIPKENIPIDKNFLYYSLKSVRWNEGINKAVKGLTLNKSLISQKEILLPNLTIQKEIASNLDNIENFLELRKSQLDYLKELNKSLFTTMFGDIKTNDKNWEIRKIEDCTLNNIKNIDLKTNGEITYIDISSINNKENIISSYKKYDNIREAPSRAKKILNENDILISTVRPALKNIAIFNKKNSELTIGSTGFCVLRPKDTIDSKYIFEIIKSNNFTEILIKRQIGANYPAVSDRDIKSIKIPIPPIELQNKFAERIEKIEKLKFEIEKSIEIAQNLYDSLISKYFDN